MFVNYTCFVDHSCNEYNSMTKTQYVNITIYRLDHQTHNFLNTGRAGGSNTKIKQVKMLPLINVHSKTKSI